MKKVWDFLNTTLGVGLLMLLVLVLVALFGGRNVVGPTGQPLATVMPVVEVTPTSIPRAESGFRAENIKVLKEAQITTDGKFAHLIMGVSWSPDSSKILFTKFSNKTISDSGMPVTEIWVANADGTFPRQMAESGYWPTWSSDGSTIAYVSYADNVKETEIWTMNVDSTGKRKLNTVVGGSRVAWLSNDTLAFIDNARIYRLGRDGNGLTQISEREVKQAGPVGFVVSPDGKKLAIVNGAELWVLNADGSDPVKLNDHFYDAVGGLAWSPDSQKIVYGTSAREIYIVEASVMKQTKLINLTGRGGPGPFSWSPDGNVITFGATIDGISGIFVINIDGTGLGSLLRDVGFPVWSPDGKKIAFERSDGNLWVAFLSLE